MWSCIELKKSIFCLIDGWLFSFYQWTDTVVNQNYIKSISKVIGSSAMATLYRVARSACVNKFFVCTFQFRYKQNLHCIFELFSPCKFKAIEFTSKISRKKGSHITGCVDVRLYRRIELITNCPFLSNQWR